MTAKPTLEHMGAGSRDQPVPEAEYLQIGEVADLTQLTQRTLRYYEELQLLDPPTRMAGGFRLYSPADVTRLRHILRLKQLLGFSLAEVKAILRAEDAVARPIAPGESTANVRRRLDGVGQVINNTVGQLDLLNRKLREMEVLRDDLSDRLQDLESRRAAMAHDAEGAEAHAASEYS